MVYVANKDRRWPFNDADTFQGLGRERGSRAKSRVTSGFPAKNFPLNLHTSEKVTQMRSSSPMNAMIDHRGGHDRHHIDTFI